MDRRGSILASCSFLRDEELSQRKNKVELPRNSTLRKEEQIQQNQLDLLRESLAKIQSSVEKTDGHIGVFKGSSKHRPETSSSPSPRKIFKDEEDHIKPSVDPTSKMSSVLKKVSANMSRVSKGKDSLPEGSSTSQTNYSGTSGQGGNRSRSREKTDISSGLSQNSIANKLRKSRQANPTPFSTVDSDPSKILDGFKRKTKYQLLKTVSKDILGKKTTPGLTSLPQPSQSGPRKRLDAKISNRVFEMLRKNPGSPGGVLSLGVRSAKDPSSRESSKSAQRSLKEKSVKSKKSVASSGGEKKREGWNFKGFDGLSILQTMPNATRSNAQSLIVNKPPLPRPEVPKFDDSIGPSSREHSNPPGHDHNDPPRKLVEMLKKMNLGNTDDRIPFKKAKEEHKLVKEEKEVSKPVKSKITKPDLTSNLFAKPAVPKMLSTKTENTKKPTKTTSGVIKPSAISFKEFPPNIAPSIHPTTHLTISANIADLSSKKAQYPHSQPQPKKTNTKAETKEKRSASGKRKATQPAAPNTTGAVHSVMQPHLSVFTNSYLITHVHQVNNLLYK
jgi:hypothetical protein